MRAVRGGDRCQPGRERLRGGHVLVPGQPGQPHRRIVLHQQMPGKRILLQAVEMLRGRYAGVRLQPLLTDSSDKPKPLNPKTSSV